MQEVAVHSSLFFWPSAAVVHYYKYSPLRDSELRNSANSSSAPPPLRQQPNLPTSSQGKGLILQDRSLQTNVKPKCFPLILTNRLEQGEGVLGSRVSGKQRAKQRCTLFYCGLLYCASRMDVAFFFSFLQIESKMPPPKRL